MRYFVPSESAKHFEVEIFSSLLTKYILNFRCELNFINFFSLHITLKFKLYLIEIILDNMIRHIPSLHIVCFFSKTFGILWNGYNIKEKMRSCRGTWTTSTSPLRTSGTSRRLGQSSRIMWPRWSQKWKCKM